MENKLTGLRIRRIILYVFALLITAVMIVMVWYITDILRYRLLLSAGLFCILLLFFFIDRLQLDYTDKLLQEVSELINTLINNNNTLVFTETEDTLLSKLQSQVLKLAGMLHLQRAEILNEKNEIKSLISDIAHQMKTPVATVKMYGELLNEESISTEERKEYLETLLDALDKLCFLTESMIKMSRLESGIIELKPCKTEVNNIILEAVKQVFLKAYNKGIDIEFKPCNEVIVNVDTNWTREALFNILDNAVKYTKSGGKIEISITKYELFVCIGITDTGVGIPIDETEKIFKRFFRGIRADAGEGIGIGLYITRQIIMRQGGYIKVRSDGQMGSEFMVYLPIEQ